MPSSAKSLSETSKRAKLSPEAKKKDSLLRRYPTGAQFTEDASSTESHLSAITTELAKVKPRDSVLLPLMKSIYPSRRLFVLNDATSAREILDVYPALKRHSVIEQEISLIIGSEDCKANFLSNWKKFYCAILVYGQKCGKKGVSSVLKEVDESDEISKQICALKVLAISMGKGHENLIYIYEEYLSDVVSVEDAIESDPVRNAPHVAAMISESNTQYFVFMEQAVLCEVPSLPQALFVAFGCYYVYNLQYPPKASIIFFLLQDYLLGFPDSLKRPSSYIAVLSDIKKHLC